MSRRVVVRVALVILALLSAAPDAHGQTRSPTVEEAIRLRDAGQFDAVIALLEPYVQRTPEDREAPRILAQVLFWVRRWDASRRVYDAALQRHPEDAVLRLEYGRMLAETGEGRRARDVVQPLVRDATMRPYAEALLGTVAYWEGDLTTARRLLRSALQGDPAQEEARRQLGEIAAVGAPWISAAGDVRTDDQPLDRRDVHLAGGVALTPLLHLTARAGVGRIESADSLSLDVQAAEMAIAHYAPAVRLESEAAVGALQRADGVASEWTGRVRVGLRLPAHVTIRASAQREPYLYTAASVRAPVVATTATALVAVNSPRGWLGEMAVQRAAFPDGNAVRTSYAWLLAPLVQASGTRLQVGYGATRQDAEENRFVLADPDQPFLPGDPRFSLAGVYAPYFTPANLSIHSLLAALESRAGRATLRASGSYGVRATDEEPVLYPPAVSPPGNPRAVERGFVPRSFSPWTVRGGIDFTPSADFTLGLAGESWRTVFYGASTLRLTLTYRFASAAARRATGSITRR